MDLERQLAARFLESHPDDSARVLEGLPPQTTAAVLADAPALAAGVVPRMSPYAAAEVLGRLEGPVGAEIVAGLDRDVAARLLRRQTPELVEAVLERLSVPAARALRSLLRFPEDTAGALMDPEVLALPEDLTAEEAVERIRAMPQHARYNLYVVDRDQKLVGVLNLRELLLAPRGASLASAMCRDVLKLAAGAGRQAIVGHPGWRNVTALPVVDEKGVYLGAMRYRLLRRLEGELMGRARDSDATASALGELFATGAAGLLEALTGGRPADSGGGGGGRG